MVFVVAEIGVNWDGDFELVKQMMYESKILQLRAVKFQAFTFEMVKDHPESKRLMNSSITKENVEKIGQAGKPFDICYLPTQLSVAYDFAKNCDETNLVLNHCGVPSIAAGEIDQWGKDIKKLSALPNVTCKLSGLMAYCAPGTSSQETIQPYVDHVLECFGPNRMVWGSDWPVVNLGKGIQEWITVTRNILSSLSEDEAVAIGNGNAQKIYKVSL